MTRYWCTLCGSPHWHFGWQFADTPAEAARKALAEHNKRHPGDRPTYAGLQTVPDYGSDEPTEYFTVPMEGITQ